ncbi:MAG: hypothetical protein ACFFCE_18640 [Promethearchaeota archaeon]
MESINEEYQDPIDINREKKRWKKSINCYMLHPNGFAFGLEDFIPKKRKRY